MIAVVSTVAGTFSVDLETDEVGPWTGELVTDAEPVLNLPRLVAAAATGATVFAVVATKPPIVVSRDAGSTWRESGRGLPPGRAIAVSADDPDLAVYAARNRLFVTHDGGVFWTALAVELPEIEAVAIRD
jgi:photosystem II stability/assembly factor-like uncharacterized protein